MKNMPMLTNIPPKAEDVKGKTVGEICQMLRDSNPGMDYDTAMPQGLVNTLMDAGFDPRGKCFMCYLDGYACDELHGLILEWHHEVYKILEGLR